MAKSKNKQANDESHCMKRLRQRFAIDIQHDEYRRLVNCFRSPGAKTYDDIRYEFVDRSSNTRSIYRVWYKGTEFYAVYNRSSKSIVTVLFTPEEVERLGLSFEGGTDDGNEPEE